jgi:hypothetical protein
MADFPRAAPAILFVLVAALGFAGVTRAARAGPAPRGAHWAFQALRRPDPPDRGGAAAPIDRFILARLQREALPPSPRADRRTLIRRVSQDLVGLPPSPEETDSFLSDPRPDAWSRLVDRLLASPHFGEKWARHWLDLCHYGDTDGYLTDQLRPVAWRYRAWLVDALNRDLPFSEFTLHQLAGDLLPGGDPAPRIATGFLRQTLSNREGGADLEEFRVEQVVDRVNTVATTWLGLTVGCARCHDHKYDPISQREYYQLYACLDAGDELNFDAPLPGEAERYTAPRAAYLRRREELLRPGAAELTALQRDWEQRMLAAAGNPGRDHRWDREWEVLGLIWGGNLGEGQLTGTRIVRTDPARRSVEDQERLLDYFLKHGAGKYPDEFKRLGIAELRAALEKAAKEVPAVARAAGMAETPFPREVRIHQRGDFRVPGPKVTAGVPAFLPPLAPTAGAGSPRLALARWLAARENPLPARVFANRVWQELFGTGLVLTSEDFGSRGDRPTHPELLDWLAAEFLHPSPGVGPRAPAGSLKHLIRTIVLSEAYRRSSAFRPDVARRDPGNRLLARQAPLRLSAEQLRDAALAVSGLLNPTVGGPPVFPPQPEAVVMDAYDNKWTPSAGANRYRRGLYTFVQRLSPFAQNVTFDAPAPSRSCSRRERSNTPLQALTLLNDPVFWEAARALGARSGGEEPSEDAARIVRLFRLALGRRPSPVESARLEQVVLSARSAAPGASAKPGTQEADPAPEWTAAASVLLNLHEFVTRD